MRKGGYQIVNFREIPLTAGKAATIPGVYAALERTNKAILVSGIIIGGVEYDDCFVMASVTDSNYKFTAFGYDFVITPQNSVTATAVSAK